MTEPQILVLLVPAQIKDDLVDELMSLDGISGFSLSEIAGYSAEHSAFSVTEQVQGYRSLFRFEVLHQRAQQQHLLNALQPVCQQQRARYWIVPALEQGHFE